MIDLPTIYETLQEWGKTQIRLRFVWQHMAEEYKRTLEQHSMVGVFSINSIRTLGRDEIRYEARSPAVANRDLTVSVIGSRAVGVNIEVRSRDQRPQNNAIIYCEQLRSSLRKPSAIELFNAANMSVFNIGDLGVFDEVFDDRWESVARFIVEFGVGVHETDEREETGAIETIIVSSDIKDVDGSSLPASLQMDNEEITE